MMNEWELKKFLQRNLHNMWTCWVITNFFKDFFRTSMMIVSWRFSSQLSSAVCEGSIFSFETSLEGAFWRLSIQDWILQTWIEDTFHVRPFLQQILKNISLQVLQSWQSWRLLKTRIRLAKNTLILLAKSGQDDMPNSKSWRSRWWKLFGKSSWR